MPHPRRIIAKLGRPVIPAAAATVTAVAAVALASAQPAAAAAAVTQVKPGTSLSSVHVQAGHSYAFQRGATYTGTLNVNRDSVRIGAYGTGQNPVFQRSTAGNDITVSGNNDFIAHIRLTGKGYQKVPGCGSARTAGYEVGIDVTGSGDQVYYVRAYGNLYAGVYVETAGDHAVIRHSVFDGVNALNPGNLGAGAFGILLWGDHNTIDQDTFENQSTCSPDFGTDGSGVEIYHGSFNLIEHSTGRADSDFTELGGAGATTNTYLDNTFSAPGEFLVTRGSGDTANGPVRNTILTGNVAHGAVVSYDWRPGSGTLLTMKDNHVSRLSQDGGFVDKGGNVIGF
ncbi:MAG TPA: hypothetical protein VH637_11955 [Streptosporangiaceae bacterium]